MATSVPRPPEIGSGFDFDGGTVLEQTALEFFAGRGVVGLGQHAAGAIALEFVELVAVDGDVEAALRGRRAGLAAQQVGAQQQGERKQGQGRDRGEECRSHFLSSSASSAAARFCSSVVRCSVVALATVRPRWRRYMMRAATATSSNRNGPPQSSQVVGLTGGR